MRILYSHYLEVDRHPAVRMIQAIGDELRSMGHEVLVHRSFGPEPPAPARLQKATAVRSGLLAAAKGSLWFAKAMCRNFAMTGRDLTAIDRFRPDIVLARQDAYCWSMPKACLQTRTPLVGYADAPVAYETRTFAEGTRWHPPRLVEAIERWGLRHGRAVITVSHPAAERLRRYHLDVPVHVIPNGVHPERFPSLTPAQREAERKRLGLTARRIIGVQGTFRPFHGVDLLRELMLANASRSGIQWLLIGDGPKRAALEQAVAGRVPAVFLGMQPAERVGRLLGLVDVAVVPHAHLASDFYFCPLKIVEFAAAGCAVIASNQGDIPRLLDDGRAGLLVSKPNRDAWQAALDRVLDDDTYRQSLGRDARRFVLANLTWQHTARRVEAVLRQVLADGCGKGIDVENEAANGDQHAGVA